MSVLSILVSATMEDVLTCRVAIDVTALKDLNLVMTGRAVLIEDLDFASDNW